METKKFKNRKKQIAELLPYMTSAQLAEIAELALSQIRSDMAEVPQEVLDGIIDLQRMGS